MTFEVVVEPNEQGEFVASAVDYPGVSATGRTEKEALALVTRALELHLKRGGKPAAD
jgi:predicted RNase H-like HicB family nuclease